MRSTASLALAPALALLGAGPAAAGESFSVSCRIAPDGRIVPVRNEPRDIYEHASQFAGRSHQAPDYRGRRYHWRGRIEIAESLYADYRPLPRFLGRRAFERIGSDDGIVYVYVQSLGCLFNRYVPRAAR